jgi:peptide/nickel transport system substrate-binding protein
MFEWRSRKVALATVLLLLFVVNLAIVAPLRGSGQSSSCPDSQTLKLGLYGGSPNSFNMLTALPVAGVVDSLLQYYQMYPPPTLSGQLDYNESVIDWYSHNSNYSQWTFNVKPGLYWSNGQPVNASDIINTYSQNFALNSTVDFVNAASEISSIVALNSSAAQFNLNKSDAVFPERVGSSLFTPIMSSSFISHGAANDGFGFTNVAVGPFYSTNYSAGSTQGVFLRNQYFKPLPNACELLVQYFESDSSIPSYIQSGAIDFGPIPPASASSMMNSPNVHIIDEKSLIPEMLTYNVTKYPYNETAFRQALLFGANLTQISQEGDQGYGETAYTSEGGIPMLATSFYNPHQSTYSYNPSRAMSLLSSIGINKGSDGFLQYPNGTDITLTVWYDNSFAENAVAMQYLSQNWQSLGFKVVLNAAALGTLIQDSYGNTNNINSAMIYFKSYGAIYGYPWTAGLNSFAIDVPFNAPPSWEGPPGSVNQTEFVGNLTALASTDDPTLDQQYLANIQALNSANLPVITLGYGDAIWAYNTLRWTNWPSQNLVILPNTLNSSALAELQPVGATSSSSSSTTTSSTPTSSSSQSSTSTQTQSLSSTSSTSSSSSTSTGIGTTTLIAVGVVIVIIVAGVAAFAMRRKPAAAAAPT